LGGGAAIAAPGLARAQAFPNRPIHLVVPFPPGAAPDVTARLVAPVLAEQLGQSVIVDNRPGAGSNIGTQQALRAAPDGYTLLQALATNTVNATLYQNLDFDFPKDITPVARMIAVANVAVVPASFPANDIGAFIAHCKANPGKVNMASSGIGTAAHVSGELLKSLAGLDIVHVPYSGNYFPDLIAGQVQFSLTPLTGAIGFIRSGQLRALAVSTRTRSEFLPDVPALGEVVPGYEAAGWYGLVGPKGMAPDIVARLNDAAVATMANATMKARLPDIGGSPFPAGPAEFGAFIDAETAKWAKVIKAANIKAE
jgi:tripartite-type tricarboxylate transporter receptor subunit TctC